jgi:hypothetical protein
MKKTILKPVVFPFSISHQTNVLFLGSCFSENLSELMVQHGFNISSNPYGVLFHPFSLSKIVRNVLNNISFESSIVQRDDVFLSWNTNSLIYGMSRDELQAKLVAISSKFKTQLIHADVLFITLGTAWEYQQKTTGVHVANCHKFPSENFEKSLTSIKDMESILADDIKLLLTLNPSLKIVLTVSPVRHSKDGLIENSRSKARILEVAHLVKDKFSAVHYFPAYELVLDELRDYAYFNEDGVHPNKYAIDQVWNYFVTSFFNSETQNLAERFNGLLKLAKHRLIHEESQSSIKFKENLIKKIKELQIEAPLLNFSQLS